MSRPILQLCCPFSGPFPHTGFEVLLAGPHPLSSLSCTFVSHTHPTSLLSMRFSESGHDEKVHLDIFWSLTAKVRRNMEKKNKFYCENGFLCNLCLHKRKWDLISLRISLHLWTTLAWIHLDKLSSLTLYTILFAFCCFMIVDKKKMLFILICLKYLNTWPCK